MIESIEKVKVIDRSEVQPLTREAADSISHQYGVYLLFHPMKDEDPTSFRARSYCKIGRAAGNVGGVRGRLLGNIVYHEKPEPDNECGPLEGHYFQVLACENGTDAARLESLFHLWHGRYEGGFNIIEPRGTPKAEKEPDFFYLEQR